MSMNSPPPSSPRLRASSSAASLLRRRNNTSTNSLSSNASTLRDVQKQERQAAGGSSSSSPTKFLQQLRTISTFILSLLLVRWIVFELRPFHEFRWTREIVVWIGSYRLFLYLIKRQNRRPLLNYGRWALIVMMKNENTTSKSHLQTLDTWSKALCARGMRVGVILEENDDDDESFLSTWHETVELSKLESWLGFKQWEGGVGVAVLLQDEGNDGSSQDGPSSYLQAIQQHMAFRHSGAIVRVVSDNNNDDDATANDDATNKADNNNTDDPPFLYAQHGIVLLEVPQSLLSYSTVVDAALEKVGETKQLTTRHVLWQRVKQLWRTNVLSW